MSEDQKKEKKLMKIVITSSILLLIVTGVVYYYTSVHDWNENDVLIGDESIVDTDRQEMMDMLQTTIDGLEEDIELWEMEEQMVEQCAKWLSESEALVQRYDGEKNIALWSQDDRKTVLLIEDQYVENCIPKKQQIISSLDGCTDRYIMIQYMIDRMVEMQLDSLTQEEQDLYNSSYDYYFDHWCNKIFDDIIQHPNFVEFNATRNE